MIGVLLFEFTINTSMGFYLNFRDLIIYNVLKEWCRLWRILLI
jgi:hypothetical protein